MDMTVKTPKEEYIDTIDDLTIPEDVLYTNNTFNLNALNETLERLSLINFWSLYQTQKVRLHMERFDIPFREFKPTYRLPGERGKDYFPKRNIAYIDYQFIHAELRRKFRNSEFFNKALNQETIAANPDLFRWNHLVFIDGNYISTTEVYPMEAKTGIIIDVESNHNEHGLTYIDYNNYTERNATVTVLMVPSFKFAMVDTNQYVIDNYHGRIPFSKIPGSETFTENTLCLLNAEELICRRFFSDRIKVDVDNQIVRFMGNLDAGGNKYRLCFITFDFLFAKKEFTKENPYIQLNEAKMPCPKEQIFFLTKKAGEIRYFFNANIKTEMYYPNIYKFSGLEDDETGIAIILQDEDSVSRSEEYMNELQKYEEYIEMLPRYQNDSIPEILKTYRPSMFTYSIKDYESSVYVPDTMNYKVQKLHKTIYENPWALVVYLDLLNLPMDKFYLDMEKIDLSNRIRLDSSREEVDSGTKLVTFDEPRYVFAMNRHFVDTRSYGFRIFIDGYFQLDNTYTVLSGPNFYFIYIPVSKITETSMIEIERYKLFTIEKRGVVVDTSTPVIEIDFSQDRHMFGYSREIYAVDMETRFFIPKKYLKIEVLYGFTERAQKWVTIPEQRNIPLENKVRVTVLNEAYVGKTVRIGIQRKLAMSTGDVFHEADANKASPFWYAKGEITNFGEFDRGNYRIFNKGRMLLPIQYYINLSEKYGGKDFFRTSCELHEGDQFTIDHVPAQFRVVYYQYEVDSVNKKGYVDLDGKIALPISLKWYDIYLNGRKLHKKNIEIISPTKFYIEGVESRKHLIIVAKNRDTEIFHLPYYEDKMDEPVKIDWNNTIIDDLMNVIYDLKETIDNTKPTIENEEGEIATNVAKNIDGLVFFFEYMMYTFINANKRQITQEFKELFPSLLTENAIMPIDSNDGAIKNNEISGYLIKAIDCNIQKGEEDMFTDPNVNYDGIGALQDRFALRPLNTDNYEYGLREEFMTDPNTAEPALVNADGTVTAISTMTRLNHHIEDFSSKITTYGMGRADIYQITFDNEYKTALYTAGENMLTEEIETPEPVLRVCLGLDTTFLAQYGDCKMLKVADIDPIVTIGYKLDGEPKEMSCKLTRLKDNAIEAENKVVTLDSIVMTDIPDTITKIFIHSILLAF